MALIQTEQSTVREVKFVSFVPLGDESRQGLEYHLKASGIFDEVSFIEFAGNTMVFHLSEKWEMLLLSREEYRQKLLKALTDAVHQSFLDDWILTIYP